MQVLHGLWLPAPTGTTPHSAHLHCWQAPLCLVGSETEDGMSQGQSAEHLVSCSMEAAKNIDSYELQVWMGELLSVTGTETGTAAACRIPAHLLVGGWG
jgi:hypothetical protein